MRLLLSSSSNGCLPLCPSLPLGGLSGGPCSLEDHPKSSLSPGGKGGHLSLSSLRGGGQRSRPPLGGNGKSLSSLGKGRLSLSSLA